MRLIVQFLFLTCFLSFHLQGIAQSRLLRSGKVKTSDFFETIPIEFEKNKIYLSVEINGKDYRFLLDTGAPNVISREVYQSINPEIIESIATSDANNLSQDLKVVQIEKVKIGTIEFKDYSALVFDLNSSPVFRCLNVDGFIGSNLLKDIIIQIDAKSNILKLTDRTRYLKLNKKDAERIKLVNDQSSPYVWIDLIGEDSGREFLLIDTGMGGLYDIAKSNYQVFSKKKIFNAIGSSEGASSISLFGEVPKNKQFRLHVPQMIINDFQINNIITHTTNDDNSRIGAEILNYGVMTIDYRNKRLYFDGYSDAVQAEGDLGLTQTLKDNQLVIGYVWDEYLKEKVSYGDIIVEVNGEPIEGKSICDYVAKKSITDGNKVLSLKVRNPEGEHSNIYLKKRNFEEILEDYKNN